MPRASRWSCWDGTPAPESCNRHLHLHWVRFETSTGIHGAQFRTDYPERNDDEWLKHIDLTLDGDRPNVSYSEVTITQWEPEERKY